VASASLTPTSPETTYRETCCPLIALPSDVMRGSDAVKGSYREVLEKLVEIFMDDLNEPQRRERALALGALCEAAS
jgi:TetR/AcrR family transcriptional regulator, transcriptional repressor for nem operon